jgi:hypothetical protein
MGVCGAVDSHANPVRRCATLPLRGAAPGAGSVKGARFLGSVSDLIGPVLRPLGQAVAPVGSALGPVVGWAGAAGGSWGAAGAGWVGCLRGLRRRLGRPSFFLADESGPSGRRRSQFARRARSIRSWPALTGAVSLPGSPASAELPAGGPDPLSSSSGGGLGLVALTAALVLLDLIGRRKLAGSAGTGGTGASVGTGGSTSDMPLDGLSSGSQVDAGIGDISRSVPVMICGNRVGVLGDASAGCAGSQPAAPTGGSSGGVSGAGSSGSTQAGGTLSGSQVDVSADDISPSVPVMVCGNGAGALGDASASCGTGQAAGSGGGISSGSGSTGAATGAGVDVSTGPVGAGSSIADSLLDDVASGNQVDAGIGSVSASASAPLTVCGNGVVAPG